MSWLPISSLGNSAPIIHIKSFLLLVVFFVCLFLSSIDKSAACGSIHLLSGEQRFSQALEVSLQASCAGPLVFQKTHLFAKGHYLLQSTWCTFYLLGDGSTSAEEPETLCEDSAAEAMGETSCLARQKLPVQGPGELQGVSWVFPVYKAYAKLKSEQGGAGSKQKTHLTFTYEPPNLDLLKYQELM